MNRFIDLTGKIALVTGAGQGMGVGIAMRLAMQGATVLVNDYVPERADATVEKLRQIGLKASALPFDVTNYDQVKAAASQVGQVDILVNNAGNMGSETIRLKKFLQTNPAEWAAYVGVNLYGVMNCAHIFAPGMCERGWGRIITVSSDAGRIGLPLGVAVYGAAKAGVLGLTRHLAHEFGPKGVTVNALTLGTMNNGGDISPEVMEASLRTVPMRILGAPEDVGAAAAFLASPDAKWITGQVLAVNGGGLSIGG